MEGEVGSKRLGAREGKLGSKGLRGKGEQGMRRCVHKLYIV